MQLTIGCPVYDRGFILEAWFEAIVRQDFPLDHIGFVFITAGHDPDTHRELMRFAEAHPEVLFFDVIENIREVHDTHPEGKRIWTHQKYQKMVRLRNQLLERVVCHNPDRFFSLDSDILLEDPSTLRYLIQLTATLPAVAPLLYMTPDSLDFPSTMSWVDEPGGVAARIQYPIGTLFQTEIIMAAKMMTKPVYQQVRYHFHPQGEDLGWSLNAAQLGFPLYLASSIYVPHIMSRGMLEIYQQYGDPRRPVHGSPAT